jgi:hypothetical protein
VAADAGGGVDVADKAVDEVHRINRPGRS